MPRLYVAADLRRASLIVLSGEHAHRLARVLRLRPGDDLVLFDGSGSEFAARLESVRAAEVVARIESERPGLPEPRLRLTLYQSVVKGGRFEWVLEKGTELGVAAFVPLRVGRSVVQVREDSARAGRWRRVVIEAAEQCGRSVVPAVLAPQPLDGALNAGMPLLLPYEGERVTGIREALARLRGQGVTSLGVVVGPEGGFEASEVERARAAGAIVVSLGPRVLRSETAGIVAAALALYELGGPPPDE